MVQSEGRKSLPKHVIAIPTFKVSGLSSAQVWIKPQIYVITPL